MAYLLEIPWEDSRYFMKKYSKSLKTRGGGLFIYNEKSLPRDLSAYVTDDFSHARWVEDDFRIKNGEKPIMPMKSETRFSPREHQKEAAIKIYRSHQSGMADFLLADKTGIGKTLSGLVAMTAIAKKEGFDPGNRAKLLVVCPKGAIPNWRQTIHNYPSAIAHMRPLIINYDQLNKLLKAPAKPGKKKKTQNRAVASRGTPLVNWDFVILDESHKLKNYPKSTVSLAAMTVAKLDKPYVKGKTPFVIFSTATPGSSPLHFSLMARMLGPLLTSTPTGKTVTAPTWGDFLESQKFAVKKGKVNWNWAIVPWFGMDSKDPAERKKYEAGVRKAKLIQRKDTKRIGAALMSPKAPFIARSPKDIAGWPEQQLIPLPISLTPAQRPIYEEAWSIFRTWLKLTPANKDPKGGMTQHLRYRQKSSLLKVEQMFDNVMDFLEADNQVFVSVQFIETLDSYKERFEAKGIKVSEISGRNVKEREEERLRFQRGETKVALCTVVEAISLHAGETLPGGGKATTNDRVTVLHDIRENPLDSIQALGRAHRDGVNSLAYVPYFDETVDQKTVRSFVNKQENMKTMVGTPEQEAQELEMLFRAAAMKETEDSQ